MSQTYEVFAGAPSPEPNELPMRLAPYVRDPHGRIFVVRGDNDAPFLAPESAEWVNQAIIEGRLTPLVKMQAYVEGHQLVRLKPEEPEIYAAPEQVRRDLSQFAGEALRAAENSLKEDDIAAAVQSLAKADAACPEAPLARLAWIALERRSPDGADLASYLEGGLPTSKRRELQSRIANEGINYPVLVKLIQEDNVGPSALPSYLDNLSPRQPIKRPSRLLTQGQPPARRPFSAGAAPC
jgi:hypothetical protein